MPYTTVLFDLDGTLTDSQQGIYACVRQALQLLEQPIPDDTTLRRFIGPPLSEGFRTICGLSEEQTRQAVVLYRERYQTIGLFENRVYNGIPELLRQLRARGMRLAVATCKPETFAVRIIEHFGLLPYFETVVGCELDGRRSQKEEVIREVLRRCDLREGDPSIVMIGDRHHDVHGARACGFDCIGVDYGFAEPGELTAAGAVAVVSSARELLPLLTQ